MSEVVHWVLEVAIQPGQTEAFKALMKEMVDATKANEPDTLAYEWNISADGGTCHIYERYKDSAATLTHLGSFGKNFAKRFMPMVKPGKFCVYGRPSADVQKGLAGLNPIYFNPIGGFGR
jgi:quinol monooxygenase YgiN